MHAKHARSSDLDGSISLCVTVDAFIEFFDTTPNIFVIVNSFIQSNPCNLQFFSPQCEPAAENHALIVASTSCGATSGLTVSRPPPIRAANWYASCAVAAVRGDSIASSGVTTSTLMFCGSESTAARASGLHGRAPNSRSVSGTAMVQRMEPIAVQQLFELVTEL